MHHVVSMQALTPCPTPRPLPRPVQAMAQLDTLWQQRLNKQKAEASHAVDEAAAEAHELRNLTHVLEGRIKQLEAQLENVKQAEQQQQSVYARGRTPNPARGAAVSPDELYPAQGVNPYNLD